MDIIRITALQYKHIYEAINQFPKTSIDIYLLQYVT